MSARAVQTVIEYRAWDTSANAPKTGDVANHSLQWIKDGTAAAPTNSPAEIDATNSPGIYKLTLTATETDCVCGMLAGKSSTASIVLFGPQFGFEYAAADSSGRVNVGKWLDTAVTLTGSLPDVNTKTIANGIIAATTFAANALDAVWSTATRTLTAATNLGIPTASDIAAAVWGVLTSTLTTASSIGKLLADNIDAAISTRSTYAGADTAGTTTLLSRIASALTITGGKVDVNDKTGFALTTAYDAAKTAAQASDIPSASTIATAVWDALTSALTTVGSIGKMLVTNIDVASSSRLAASDYTAPDNAGIASNGTGIGANATAIAALPTAATVNAVKERTDLIPDAPAAVSDVPTAIQNADTLLTRDMSAVTEPTGVRYPLQALRANRNKVSIAAGTMTVTKEDDVTASWTAAVQTDEAAAPIIGVDPA